MGSKEDPYRVILTEKELPEAWYNIQADLPVPAPPPIHPATKEPCTADDLLPLFPVELVKQEVS
ncbi:MAG: TrpB-like pyridoxal-phosphate dependent enzyme, partial [Actinobacteria bacterium]|nr:TrpB-like pyridoxal-phosphate dependent enzyme [Actinomycetota bacterium]